MGFEVVEMWFLRHMQAILDRKISDEEVLKSVGVKEKIKP